ARARGAAAVDAGAGSEMRGARRPMRSDGSWKMSGPGTTKTGATEVAPVRLLESTGPRGHTGAVSIRADHARRRGSETRAERDLQRTAAVLAEIGLRELVAVGRAAEIRPFDVADRDAVRVAAAGRTHGD